MGDRTKYLLLKYSYSFWVSQIIIGTWIRADGWHARVEEFVVDLLDTSGLVFFFFLSVSVLVEGRETGTTSCIQHMSGTWAVSRSNQNLGTTTFEMDTAMPWAPNLFRSPRGTPT